MYEVISLLSIIFLVQRSWCQLSLVKSLVGLEDGVIIRWKGRVKGRLVRYVVTKPNLRGWRSYSEGGSRP